MARIPLSELLDMTIGELNIGCHVYYNLTHYGVKTIRDVVFLTNDQLKSMHLNSKLIEELDNSLSAYGLGRICKV